ncbi:hypothetical protein [Methylobacterium nodulans]|uniref:Uncharacterized protein n=1 Tax=Methylobacterium nodulans (strain LMG 21967 / CNCM I-2342 / ORS 2060) TaxID=460265 RepID=B8IHB8_METNO|nr:hypothetical protein [Methylobacterium nodulans]ACL59810.1 conserved hypothetical protein [Methylobacterium nodulans ORS 2060]
MPSNHTSSRRRGLMLALASGCILISTAAGVRAADEGGFGGLFQSLFGAPPAQTAAPAAVAAPLAEPGPRLHRRWAGRNRAAQARAALRHRTRYVALPKPEKIEKAQPPKLAAPAERITSPSEARAALMRDPTLRPGDIVILPEGPRVFMGEAGTTKHRPSEFEDVRRSRLVSARTRRELLAMTAPVGALPADEARKLMTRFTRRGPKPWSEPAEARTETAMRVIYPAR